VLVQPLNLTNLLLNPSFEDWSGDNPAEWKYFVSWGWDGSYSSQKATGKFGSNAFRMILNGTGKIWFYGNGSDGSGKYNFPSGTKRLYIILYVKVVNGTQFDGSIEVWIRIRPSDTQYYLDWEINNLPENRWIKLASYVTVTNSDDNQFEFYFGVTGMDTESNVVLIDFDGLNVIASPETSTTYEDAYTIPFFTGQLTSFYQLKIDKNEVISNFNNGSTIFGSSLKISGQAVKITINYDLKVNSSVPIDNYVGKKESIRFTVFAPSGVMSTTKVYCGSLGKPSHIDGASSWSYDAATKILTLTVTHHSPATVTVYWGLIADGQPVFPAWARLMAMFLVIGVLFYALNLTIQASKGRRISPGQIAETIVYISIFAVLLGLFLSITGA